MVMPVVSAEPATGAFAANLSGLDELWQQTLGDPGITIAILDGPVDTSHPSLAQAAITQVDFVGNCRENGPAEQHGTHTASIIFGQHDGPVKGIAPRCRGLVIPIFRNSPQGAVAPCSQTDLARAIRAATNAGAHVINVSAGQFATCGIAHPALTNAVRHCADEGRLIIAAAGNDGCECLHVPGALPSVLAVGAMDDRGEPLPSSNWGNIYRYQGILAPGQNIPGAVPAGGVVPRSGTSFAAALVSGIAGLLLSFQKKQGHQPDPLTVRNALLRTAHGCTAQESAACDRLLAGRLNISGAIQFLTPGVQHMSQHLSAHNGDHAMDDRPIQAHEASSSISPACDSKNASTVPAAGLTSTSMNIQSPGGPTAEPAASRRVTLAECGCGCQNGVNQKVYAIGQLGIDFVSPSRLDSLQEQNTGFIDVKDSIHSRDVLLRYLLGFNKDSELAGDFTRQGRLPPQGNLHVAESVYWVLKQGECPLYVVRPEGPFAAAAYQQLIIFLIEQSFAEYKYFEEAGIGEACLEHCFYPCYGGVQQHYRDYLGKSPDLGRPPDDQSQAGQEEPAEPRNPQGLRRDRLIRDAGIVFGDELLPHVVIAGEITGTARLYSGETVEVVRPAMRGLQNWTTRRLFEKVENAFNELDDDVSEVGTDVQVLLAAILSKLYQLVRNDGKDPCDRAKNYFATAQLLNLPTTLSNLVFLRLLGALKPGGKLDPDGLVNIAVNTLECKPAACARYGAEPYEVELSFYNFANQFMGSAVWSQMVDVSDVVPAALEAIPRLFPRRT
jgi:hypothetical protein